VKPAKHIAVVALLAIVAVAVLAASGCGGNDSPPTAEEFEESVVSTRDRVDFAIERMMQADSKEEFLNRMTEASVAIEAAATDFDEAGIAEGFEEEGEQFGTSLHQLSVDFEAAASDIGNPAFAGLISGTQALQFESWDQANLAIATMVGKGFTVQIIAPR
jgi:hypothetical protein